MATLYDYNGLVFMYEYKLQSDRARIIITLAMA